MMIPKLVNNTIIKHMEKNKTVVQRIYDMLDEGKVSDLAEIREYFLMLEAQQAIDFALAAYIKRSEETNVPSWQIRNEIRPFTDYFVEAFGNRWYEVWTEGYAATGESSSATFHGKYFASSFRDAVLQWVDKNPNRGKDFSEKDGVMRLWGCRFFDNEKDARAKFG